MARPITIKDPLLERRMFIRRTVAALAGSLLLTLALIARLVYLQVVSYDHYRTLSENNRIKIQPVPPTRGLIYDRHGVLLAENLPSYRLELIPEQVGEANMERTLDALGRIINIRPVDRERFQKLRRRMHRFESIPLRFHLSPEEVARFAVNRYRFPGVEVHAGLSRHYPYGRLTAHVVGYVGRMNEQDLKRLDPRNYRGTTHTGRVGIERAYEPLLHGTVGYEQVETNAEGRTLRVLKRQDPVPGSNLYLSLDLRLQRAAMAAFGHYAGAAVALDPRTGQVLAMVSVPTYDPNLFVNGIDRKRYQALNTDPERPLFNRALRGQYPPGSTLKPFVGLAGLELGFTTRDSRTFCPGYYMLKGGKRKYRDWKRTGHGFMDITHAITQSCDVYFYDLAHSLGIDRLHDFLAHFGFGRRSGIDLMGERAGNLPSSAWKRRAYHQAWYPGETLIAGIGQGYDLATPIQLAVAVATLASYGQRHTPRLARALALPGDVRPRPLPPTPVQQVPVIDRRHWSTVIHAMGQVVANPHGTARRIRTRAYSIGGKTGTAQVFGLKENEKYNASKLAEKLRDHALFVAFAPVDHPRIAVAVVVEHGGSGGAVAAPIARRIMDAYFGVDSDHGQP